MLTIPPRAAIRTTQTNVATSANTAGERLQQLLLDVFLWRTGEAPTTVDTVSLDAAVPATVPSHYPVRSRIHQPRRALKSRRRRWSTLAAVEIAERHKLRGASHKTHQTHFDTGGGEENRPIKQNKREDYRDSLKLC